MRKRIVIGTSFIVLLVIGFIVYSNLSTSFSMELDHIEYVILDDYDVTQQMIDKTLEEDFLEESGLYTKVWNIGMKKNYGKALRILYVYKIERDDITEEYYVSPIVHLNEDDNIIMLQSDSNSDEGLFDPIICSEDRMTGEKFENLYGCTCGKSDEEIEKFIRNIEYELVIQYPDGTMKNKTVSSQNVSIQKIDPEDIDTGAMVDRYNRLTEEE